MSAAWTVGIFGVIFSIFAFVYLASSIKIVRPYEKGVVERLGKYQRTFEPGLHVIVPFIDRITKVDMRENVVDVPPQEVITKDNVVVTVDAVVYYEATDPVKLIYNVANFYMASTKLAQTNLRNVVGEMQLDESLTSRETINATLRQILDDATDKWGVRVVRVELQRIEPPLDVTEAMHRQMKAERNKRALILEAEGDKQAAITRAEGSKQAAILDAEGRATAIKEVAEAEKFQRIALAEGEARGIENVFGAIHAGNPTPDVLAIRYLEALPEDRGRQGDQDLHAARGERRAEFGGCDRGGFRDGCSRRVRRERPRPESCCRRLSEHSRVLTGRGLRDADRGVRGVHACRARSRGLGVPTVCKTPVARRLHRRAADRPARLGQRHSRARRCDWRRAAPHRTVVATLSGTRAAHAHLDHHRLRVRATSPS